MRPVVVDASHMMREDAEGLRTLIARLGGTSSSGIRFETERNDLRIYAEDGFDTLDVPYDAMPRGLKRRSSIDPIRAELTPFLRRLTDALLHETTLWIGIDDDQTPLNRRWDAWDDLQAVAEAVMPDFLDQVAYATEGYPWVAPRCMSQFDGREILPGPLVEHVFSAHPYFIEFERSNAARTDGRVWRLRHHSGIGFEDTPSDPVRTLRLMAGVPAHLLPGAA
jgi:hypothetical protein